MLGHGGRDRGIGLMGIKSGEVGGGDGAGGDNADGAAASLGSVEKGIGGLAIVAQAETTSGTGLARGEEGGESGGITGELVGGLAFDEGQTIRLV